MVQMAPTLLEAQKLSETLKLAKTEQQLDEIGGLTFCTKRTISAGKTTGICVTTSRK